jgi:hypothetical protein
LAANPDVLESDGTINLGSVGGNATIPPDITVALNASAAATSYPAAMTTTPSEATATPSAKASGAAGHLASPRVFLAAMAVVASLFAL